MSRPDCPVCGRAAATVVDVRNEYRVPDHSRFGCGCGCNWVDPPMLPPLQNGSGQTTGQLDINSMPPPNPADMVVTKGELDAILLERLGRFVSKHALDLRLADYVTSFGAEKTLTAREAKLRTDLRDILRAQDERIIAAMAVIVRGKGSI